MMACQVCSYYQEQLRVRDDELRELSKKVTDCQLQSEGRLLEFQTAFERLISGKDGVLDDRAQLYARLAAAENELGQLKNTNEVLQNKLSVKEIELSDHAIKIRNLEEQLQAALEKNVSAVDMHPNDVEIVTKRDMERLHSQLLYKDTRIMELNSTILDKERQILDLQEMYREQNQVVQARSKAFQIVQQKVLELDSKTTREVSTETDMYLSPKLQPQYQSTPLSLRKENSRRQQDSSTPGRAVMLIKSDRHSPPPVDPSEDQSSVTTETTTMNEDGENGSKISSDLRRKQRKKVTFDLKPQRTINIEGLADGVCDDIAQAVIDLTSENDELRKIIRDLENDTLPTAQARIVQLEEEVEKVRREGKNQALKARAAVQGRIHELEEKIASEQETNKEQVGQLKSTVEALRIAREWSIEENARLLEQIAASKKQCDEVKEELKESLIEQEKLRENSEKDREMVVRLAENVEEAQYTANALLEQKVSILDDVERLKEAIEAQDEYITALEDDILIYEEHIGLLRDSLGASKVENRALIKSKAFEAKIRALEQEKEQISKRNNDERIRIKALNAKIRQLETENAALSEKLRGTTSAVEKLHGSEEESVSSITGPNDSQFQQNEVSFSSASEKDVSEEVRIVAAMSLPNISCDKLKTDHHASYDVNVFNIESLQVENRELKRRCEVSEEREKTIREEIDELRNQVLRKERGKEDEEVEDLKDELKLLQKDYYAVNERVQHMECANFELEIKLKEALQKLEQVEAAYREAEEKICTLSADWKAREEIYSSEIAALVRKDTDNNELIVRKNEQIANLEKEIMGFCCELESKETALAQEAKFLERDSSTLKNEQMIAEEKSNSVLRMESQPAKAEIAIESAENEAFLETVIAESRDEIARLQEEVDHYRVNLQEFEKLEAEKQLLERELKKIKEKQNCDIERLRTELKKEFSVSEVAQLALFEERLAEKDKLLTDSVHERENETVQLKKELDTYKAGLQEYDSLKMDVTILRQNFEELRDEKARLLAKFEAEKEKALCAEKEKCDLQHLLGGIQKEHAFLKDVFSRMRSDFDSEKAGLCELHSKLSFLMQDNEKKSQRIHELEEFGNAARKVEDLEEQCRRMIDEKEHFSRTIGQLNEQLELCRKEHGFSSRNACQIVNDNDTNGSVITNKKARLSVTDVSLESVAAVDERRPDVLCSSDRAVGYGHSSLEMENVILRECVAQNSAMQETLSEDVNKLMEIKTELETTVEALKGEVWSLNAQLRSTVNDRDQFSDKICELTQLMESEREKARQRERELEEQKDVAEKSQRQAALAENESNRRLVEWQEKTTEMTTSYTQLQSAYNDLTAYVKQIQAAYNALYASVVVERADATTETERQEESSGKNSSAEAVVGLQNRVIELESRRRLLTEQLTSMKRSVELLQTESLEELKVAAADCFESMIIALRTNADFLAVTAQSVINNYRSRESNMVEQLKRFVSEIVDNERLEGLTSFEESVFTILTLIKYEFQDKVKSLSETRQALEEKRNACDFLESRLEKYEESSMKIGPDPRVIELENMLESAEISLKEQIDKSEELQQKLDTLESLRNEELEKQLLAERPTLCDNVSTSSSFAAAHMLCRGTLKVPCSANLQLAILAARLEAKKADNDALFRCNAELAQTNLDLQNEVDILQEKLSHMSSELSEQTSQNMEKSTPPVSKEGFGNESDDSGNDWNWDASAENSFRLDSDQSGEAEDVDLRTLRQNLQAKIKEIKKLEEKERKLQKAIEMQDKRLEAAEDYGLELESKVEKLEGIVAMSNEEVECLKEKLQICEENSEYKNNIGLRTVESETEISALKEKNKDLEGQLIALKKRYEELSIKSATMEESYLSIKKHVDYLRDQSEKGAALSKNSWGWNDEEIILPTEVQDTSTDKEFREGSEVRELKATIDKLNEELNTVIKSREELENELRMSSDRFRSIETDYQNLKEQLSVCKKDLDNVQVPSVEKSFSESLHESNDLDSNFNVSSGKTLYAKEELQLNEESYLALVESEKLLKRLLEGLETKLHDTEEYSVNLSEENSDLKSTIASLKEDVVVMTKELQETKALVDFLQREKQEADKKFLIHGKLVQEKEEWEKAVSKLQTEVNDFKEVAKITKERCKEVEAELAAMHEKENVRDLREFSVQTEEETELELLKVRLTQSMEKTEKMEQKEKARDLRDLSVQTEGESDVEILKSQLEQSTERSKKLEQNLDSARKQNELLQDSECRLTEVVCDYETKLLTLTDQIEILEKSLNDLNKNYASTAKEKEQSLIREQELECSLKEAKAETKAVQEQLSKLMIQKEMLIEKAEKKVNASGDSTAVEGNFLLWSLSNQSQPSTSEQNIAADEGNEAGRERKQLITKVKELETRCEKYAQERKKMLRKLKFLQAELDTSQKDERNKCFFSPSSSVEPLRSTQEQPTSRFAVKKASISSSRSSPKPSISWSEENDSFSELSGSRRGSVVVANTVQQLQVSSDDAVRKRRSGFRGVSGQ